MKKLHIISGLAGYGKTEEIINKLLNKSYEGISCWWIVDTLKRSEILEERFLDYSNGAYGGIEILTTGGLSSHILKQSGVSYQEVDADLLHLLSKEIITDILHKEVPDHEKMVGWVNVFNRVRQKISDGQKVEEHVSKNYPWMFKAYNKLETLLSDNGLVSVEYLPKLASESLAIDILPDYLIIDNIGPVSQSINRLLKKLASKVLNSLIILEYIPGNNFVFELVEEQIKDWQLDFELSWHQFQNTSQQLQLTQNLFNPSSIQQYADNGKFLYLKHFENERNEIEALSSQIANLIFVQKIPETDIKVVCTNLNKYSSLIEEIFPQYGLDYDLRAGSAIFENELAAFIYYILKFRIQGFDRNDFISLLLNKYSNWTPFLNTDEAVFKLDTLLRQVRITGDYYDFEQSWLKSLNQFIEKEKKLAKVNPFLLKSLDFLRSFARILKKLPEKCNAADFSEWLEELFKLNGIYKILRSNPTGNLKLVNDIKVYGRINLLLEQVGKTQDYTSKKNWTLKQYFELIENEILNGRLSPNFKIKGGIKICGVGELRGISSKQIFFLGLSSDNWPQSDKEEILNPFARQWRGNVNKTVEARELTLKAVNSSKSLYLSVPCKKNDEKNSTSPIIDELSQTGTTFKNWPEINYAFSVKESLLYTGKNYKIPKNIHKLESISDQAIEACEIEEMRENPEILSIYEGYLKNTKVKNLINEKVRSKPFSVTSMETYAKCPMRYLFKNILMLEEIDDVEDEIKPYEVGNIVHNVLAEAAQATRLENGFSPTFKASNEEHLNLLLKLAKQELENISLDNLLWDIQKEKILSGLKDKTKEGYLSRFLNYEEKTLKNERIRFVEATYGDFPEEPEADKILDHFYLMDEHEKFEIRGKIDRVSYAPEKGWRIWDYKVANSGLPTKSTIEKGTALQLLVYTLVLEEYLANSTEVDTNIDFSCLYQFSEIKIRQTGKWLYSKNHLQIREHIIKKLKELFRAMLDGNYFQPLLSDKDTCNPDKSRNYCPYKNICIYNHERFNERHKKLNDNYKQSAYKIEKR